MAKFTDAVVAALKATFETGDRPTAAQFAAWIDAIQGGIEEHDHLGYGDGDAAEIPAVYKRQGGSASNWTTAGTNNYTPALSRIEVGSCVITAGNTSVVVTFPGAYADPPIVLCQAGGLVTVRALVQAVTPTTTTLALSAVYGTDVGIGWIALGPSI